MGFPLFKYSTKQSSKSQKTLKSPVTKYIRAFKKRETLSNPFRWVP
jgi:hypothetical protein